MKIHKSDWPKVMVQVKKRSLKIANLTELNNVDSRKARKAMNVHQYGRASSGKTDGFYGKKHPVRIKINAKSRRSLAAGKAIMRLQG